MNREDIIRMAREAGLDDYGPELQAMNTGMEIHDQQLDTCNIAELEEAVQLVAKTIRERKARAIA